MPSSAQIASVTQIPGVFAAHATNGAAGTGCTVIICPSGATGGVDVRGGAPATRETDLLRPEETVDVLHSVVLSGGSAFGLAAACGVADELERRVRDAMGLFQVADLADASPYQLSGGQKKRVALAAVVSMNPDILVLDEPTNGLDEDSCDIVVNFLLAYVAAGKTVLMSTHHQDLVRRLGARAIYIDRYHHVVEAPSPSYGTESGTTD